MRDMRLQLQGESQLEVMRAVWRTGGGTVEEIRSAMLVEHRGSYKTVQTLLNRLAGRELVSRTHGQRARGPTAKIVYRPLVGEDEHLADSIMQLLAGVTPEARRSALERVLSRMGEIGEDLQASGRAAHGSA